MNSLTRFKLFLWIFGRFKVPMIGYLRPRLLEITDQKIVIKLNLTRRSKNHLHSMYFGALAVGADLAGGLHAFYHAKLAKVKTSIAFKSFDAQFLKRPETAVYFVCEKGDMVKDMIVTSQKTQQRINKAIDVIGYINYPEQAEAVAKFTLELSIKVMN